MCGAGLTARSDGEAAWEEVVMRMRNDGGASEDLAAFASMIASGAGLAGLAETNRNLF